jgi:hypothetical protein
MPTSPTPRESLPLALAVLRPVQNPASSAAAVRA